MSMLRWLDMPFRYTTITDFEQKLNDWLSNVYYEILPAAGFETREEQIYTAYRIAQAFCRRQVLFAEAGSGTGKTFAYLLSAVCYARLIGKPVILSSANAALQQQLVGPQGDIATLSQLLNLDIDARLAKDAGNYLCQLKAERLQYASGKSASMRRLLAWAKQTELGDRSEIANVGDGLWQQVAWHNTLYCDRCRRRGYCQAAATRKHYLEARDFIICSHDVFFAHLWSSGERLAEKRLPLLPNFAAVVFDEGHLVEQPALRHLGSPLRQQSVTDVIADILLYRNHYRTALLLCLEGIEIPAQEFFTTLAASAIPHPEASKWAVDINPILLAQAQALSAWIAKTNDNITIETQLHIGTDLERNLNTYIQRLDSLLAGLLLLCAEDQQPVIWWEPAGDVLWILPRQFSTLLGQELTSKHLPVIFTSATLQANGSFTGLQHLLGLPQALHTQVGTSFDLANQVCAYLPQLVDQSNEAANTTDSFAHRVEHCLDIVQANGGRTLVLLRAPSELKQWQAYLQQRPTPFPYRILWEGSQDRSWLLEQYKQDIPSVLVGTDFWEGVDVPGAALSLVVVFSLPYPWDDPLLRAKKHAAEQAGLDPVATVDVPAMLIKLRQGFGRLIRLASDRGILAVLDLGPHGRDKHLVLEALPPGAKVYTDFNQALAQIPPES